jgi:hypothetical protein
MIAVVIVARIATVRSAAITTIVGIVVNACDEARPAIRVIASIPW